MNGTPHFMAPQPAPCVAPTALQRELTATREALRSGAHLGRAPREQRERRALAARVFLLTLQLRWQGCSEPSVSGPSASPLPPLGAG